MSNGRLLFQKIKPVLRFVTRILGVLPNVILRFFWALSSPFNGKLAIALRYCLAGAMGAQLGDNVLFGANIYVDGFRDLKIGNNVSLHTGCYIDARGGVSIGDNVSIAHACSLVSFEHNYAGDPATPIKYQPLRFEAISIAQDVWLGAAVRVLAGSTIGTRVVIGAGSIAKGDLTRSGLYVGSPAKRIKSLEGAQ